MTERRAALWPLRLTAFALASLGVVPTANLIFVGEGVLWWRSAVKLWLVWSAVVIAGTWLFVRLFPEPAQKLTSRAHALLLRPSPRSFAFAVSVAACVLAALFGWHLFGWQPSTGDELSQQWQAHLLTMGRLFAQGEAQREFFSTSMTLDQHGRWFGQFPIGAAALLSAGMVAHVPWLVNPLLTGVTACATYWFAAAIMPETAARRFALLFALSPFVLFMGGSTMNHVGTLAGIAVALAALPSWLASTPPAQSQRAAAVVGVGLGVAATLRPFDAAIVALVIGVFQLHAIYRRPALARSLAVQCAIGAIPVALLLAVNWATVGDPFTFAYDLLNGPEHRPGFHVSPLGTAHTPTRGLYNVSSYLMRLNVVLLGWPIPAVLLVVVTLTLQRAATSWDLLMVAIVWALILAYSTHWGESYFVGPRFLYSAVPLFLMFVARMPDVLRERLRAPAARTAVSLLFPVWLIVAWTLPERGSRPFGVWTMAKGYQHDRPIAPLILSEAGRAGFSNALVFVPDGWHARLAARLRTLAIRPLVAEQMILKYDACTLQTALDALDGWPRAGERAERLRRIVALDAPARHVADQRAADQVALVPGRPLSPACEREFAMTESRGVGIGQFLPYEQFDASGRLAGSVVYARDFGTRNERLRARFGDRDWYVATLTSVDDSLGIKFEPYVRPPSLSQGGATVRTAPSDRRSPPRALRTGDRP